MGQHTGPRGPCGRSRRRAGTAPRVPAGLALLLGSRWLLILLPPVLGLTHRVVLQEERRLEDRFGREYDLYRGRVRRYIQGGAVAEYFLEERE
jgi:hypothetical protein